jgi:enoyl-CoA hydratase
MSDSSGVELVEVEQLGKVRRLTLNRPDRSNSLSADLLASLVTATEAAADDPATSVIVLRGAGRGFCAGFDISSPVDRDFWSDRERLRRTGRALEALWVCPLPIVAQVHGYALAGGADLALHCDLLVASTHARIGYPPVRNLGVPPTNLWLYRVGAQMTKRLLLTGDSITGSEAARIGLAIAAFEEAELEDGTLALARRMALVGREMLIGNKAVVNRGIDLMGRAELNRFAESEDAVAHGAPSAVAFRRRVGEVGLKGALQERDAPFAPDPPGL